MTANPQDRLNAIPDTYTFEFGGNTFTIPSIKKIPMGVTRKARKAGGDAEVIFSMLEAVLSEGSAALEAIDSMEPAEFNAFIEGWMQGANLGESSSSES